MRHLLWAAAVAVLLAACGGGGGGGGSTVPLSQGGGGGVPAGLGSGAGAEAAGSGGAPGEAGASRLLTSDASRVNTSTAGDQALRAVGARSDGGYSVAWWSDDGTLRLQHYDSAGARSGGELTMAFAVDGVLPTLLPSVISTAALAVAPDGGVLVAYSATRDLPNPEGRAEPPISQGIYVQRFSPDGSRLQGETPLSTRQVIANYRTPSLGAVQAVTLASGGFAVGWTGIAPSSVNITYTLYHQRLDARGTPIGTATFVGSYQGGADLRLTADARGGYTAATSHLVYEGMTPVPHTAITHVLPDGTLRPVVTDRIGEALLLPLANDRYLLFTGDGAGATRQLLNADGGAAGASAAQASLPLDAYELADGSLVAVFAADGGVTVQRYDGNAAPWGEPLALRTAASDHRAAALAGVAGLALGWSAGGGDAGQDVYTQRLAAVR